MAEEAVPTGGVSGESLSRLSLSVSDACDNRCGYCACGLSGALAPAGKVLAGLKYGRSMGLDHVEFTGGEPAAHPGLPGFVAAARAMGYSTIGLSTNGRGLLRPGLAAGLASAGLGYAIVSVPAADGKTYARVCGVGREAFAENLAGLRAARTAGIREVGAAVPVTRVNAASLGAVLSLLDGFGLSFITLARPLAGYPGGAAPRGLLDRKGFVSAVRAVRARMAGLSTRVLVEDLGGDLGFLPPASRIDELRRNRYLYSDAVGGGRLVMPDAVLAGEKPSAGRDFLAAIDLQYGASDFTCAFDSRVIRGRQYHRLAREKLDFDPGSPVLGRFLSVVNKDRTLNIWGRDRADRFPALGELLRRCRGAGYRKIRLWTTGLALDDAALDGLEKLGVTGLELPIYGASAKTHDSVTGRPGSWRKLISLMERLAKRDRLDVSFHAVALKKNARELPALGGLVGSYSGDWGLSVWHYYPDNQGPGGEKRYLSALPSYASLVEAYRRSRASGRAQFTLFPDCVVDRLRGVFPGASSFRQAPAARLLVFRDGLFYYNEINSSAEFGRTRPASCGPCRRCPGVFSEYLGRFGSGEIG
ncbi:MAG: radical SAM protein [Elusimicrobia bacterium]|nr:radical SAM protein [Elusimicrobiota bacterium]